MNKRQALQTARRAIGAPCGSGTSWHVYGPYNCSIEGLKGPSTELHADSFWSARAKRAQWVAYLTLRLMGWPQEEADIVYCGRAGASSIEDLLKEAEVTQ